MRSRVLWRRSATALGTYTATILGFLATVVATRELGTNDYAKFAAIVAATAFVQLLLDLTVEEALVKYGFRYTEARRWGRLRRVFEVALVFKVGGGVLGAVALVVLAPLAASLWGVDGIVVPMTVAAAIPIVQAPEGVAAGAIILRGRYDVRGAFLTVSMGLRLAGVAIGCLWGVTGAVVGMVIAQVAATAAISAVGLAAFRRFPQEPSERLGEDVPSLRRFVFSSTASSSLSAARATLGTALVPTVAPIEQAAYFRNAQAPATGFTALSAPARMILFTEQTRDFEAGRHERMWAMLRNYLGGTTLLMLLLVPLLWWLMPMLLGLFYGQEFRVHATDAARLMLIAAALQLIWGWTKSFPVSIGRPGLRLVAQGVEVAVFVPLLLVLASRWGATGGAAAVLVSTAVFCALWLVLLARLRNPRVAPTALPG
jgi:O-antigen/teichoic acid export membrane protein